MAKFELLMPKLGESVQEATIINWFKKPGDKVEEDEAILEIATDKVDSEIPSPVDGIIEKVFFETNAVVPVGEVIAIINLDGDEALMVQETAGSDSTGKVEESKNVIKESKVELADTVSTRFYSPLVKSIAKVENISISELETLKGSGTGGRVRKQDVLKYIDTRTQITPVEEKPAISKSTPPIKAPEVSVAAGDQIVEMDRMRRLIADHMVMSKQVSPHVCNFIEADVTNLVLWRDKVKDVFFNQEKTKLTFMPVFVELTAKALKEFPGINASVDGYNIILRKDINIGMAVALPTGNLIVPVVKNADQKSLIGLAHTVNDLADAARKNKLMPDDIQNGTFTISNFGTFKNLSGTPIINQPQVAILATGNIEKKPAVLETPTGDVIAIRHKMMLSMSYDHRVVDGALAGAFMYRLKEILESFDINRSL
ncbi:MAG: dihydrolipoamide acetyltransferase family protein [Deltaproteobacteria bacterium]